MQSRTSGASRNRVPARSNTHGFAVIDGVCLRFVGALVGNGCALRRNAELEPAERSQLSVLSVDADGLAHRERTRELLVFELGLPQRDGVRLGRQIVQLERAV